MATTTRYGVVADNITTADRLGLVAYAGDVFTIRGINLDTTSVTVRADINWEEI